MPVPELKAWLGDPLPTRVEQALEAVRAEVKWSMYLQATAGVLPTGLMSGTKKNAVPLLVKMKDIEWVQASLTKWLRENPVPDEPITAIAKWMHGVVPQTGLPYWQAKPYDAVVVNLFDYPSAAGELWPQFQQVLAEVREANLVHVASSERQAIRDSWAVDA